MTRLHILVLGLVVVGAMGRGIKTSSEEVEQGGLVELVEGGREARGLADWFGWGASEPKEAPVRRNQGLQRRTSQVEGSFRGPPQPRILVNNKNRHRLRKPEQTRQQVSKPRAPLVLSKRKLLMPVIISSYASTNIQGHGNEEEELKNTIENESKSKNKENASRASQKKEQSLEEKKKVETKKTTTGPKSTTPTISTTSTETSIPSSTTLRLTSTDVKSGGRVEVTTAEVITEYVEEDIGERAEEKTQERIEENIEERTEATETNEVSDYEQSPYLPNIPELLDEDRILVLGEELPATPSVVKASERSSQYLAGYQQIEAKKKVRFPGDETSTERGREERPAPPKQSEPDFYPLGKAPKGKISAQASLPLGKKKAPRPVQPQPPVKTPVKEAESSSFFDFFPKFWQSSDPSPSPASQPARPIGPRRPPPPSRRVPTVTQLEQAPPPADYPAGLAAPLLLKVGSSNYPPQETPSRPLTRDPQVNTARIDNRIYTEGEDPFVVLPASKPQKQASPPRRGPPPPPARRPSLPKPAGQRPFGSLGPKPRPKNPRLGAGPLPMTSQPVIGLPQVPPSRKQSPFIAKRPQLPPRVPGPNNKPFSPPIAPVRKPVKPQKKILPKPLEVRKPILKKTSNPLKTTSGLVSGPQSSIPEITLRPNGSNQPGSAIANHLSSLLTSFFSTTVSPARPPAALPSLVEDTEFADVVNGYKPSDTSENTKEAETTTEKPTTTSSKFEVRDDFDDELDSLSAPLPRSDVAPLRISTTTQPSTTTTPPKTTTVASTTTTTLKTTPTAELTTTARSTYPPQTFSSTTFIAPIQEIVDDYRSQVLPQDKLDSSVYETLQKDFEQKRNIFEQFVSGGGSVAFTEIDKRFTPHKEVYTSDWTVQNGGGQLLSPPHPTPLEERLSLTDKVLVYQDLTPITTTTAATVTSASPSSSSGSLPQKPSSQESLFQGGRNAEGGFRPMIPRLS